MKKNIITAVLPFLGAFMLLPSFSGAELPKSKAQSLEALSRRVQSATPSAITPPSTNTAVSISGAWKDGVWNGTVTNNSDQAVAVNEIVMFEGEHGLDQDTPVYGESFQMLAQIVGTLKTPEDLGGYPDRKHYRIPEPKGYRTASGVLALVPANEPSMALAFTSCRKFIGRIGFNSTQLRIFMDTENLKLQPRESWKLEEFSCVIAKDRSAALEKVAELVQVSHPRVLPPTPPTGWCSWYYYYEFVMADDIRSNLAVAKAKLPAVRYIQIDDGYQSKMGDWLDTGSSFGGNTPQILAEIKASGFEPAIWVAPFIAEKTSKIFMEHPEWFVKGDDGLPLDSSKIGFGGWRCAPWYVLDGTHPAVQQHFEHVFRTMREKWGVTYFKLDANYWGAIHGGHHYDAKATRIEAYRQGMAAIQRGAGQAFILGCNAPMWPSFGLVDGMRTSGDINRKWSDFSMTGRENLARSWQNGRLWWGDPDCVVLTEQSKPDLMANPPKLNTELGEEEFMLHCAVIRASGGMVLNGDDLSKIRPDRLVQLEKLLKPSGKAMHFADGEFTVGRVEITPGVEEIALFNWGSTAIQRRVTLDTGSSAKDFWTGTVQTAKDNALSYDLKPRSAVLIVISKSLSTK